MRRWSTVCTTPQVLLGTTAIAFLAGCGHAVTMPLHSAEWAGFKPAVEMSGEFGNEGGSALDLGGVFASVFVGGQEFHVHVDTGSSMLIIPAARAQCPTCPPTQRAVRCLPIGPWCCLTACSDVRPCTSRGPHVTFCVL